ncbi:hypothetical protein [Cupriavidus taiwanensis]|uniref:hypothetical protein n=1 Tax=Cupriavidus taiwanensis TaxID=164546 RepID=UPI001F11CBB7|nr:hypothetical protein [Cupriavidus taiwanensis]
MASSHSGTACPRLDDFRRVQAEVDVRVSTAFSNEASFNGTFDVAIRRTLERGEQFESVPIFRSTRP